MRRRKLLTLSAGGLSALTVGCFTTGSRGSRTILYKDDFEWADPADSDFKWNFRLGEGANITPHPNEGMVEFSHSKTDEQAYMEMGVDSINLQATPDIRFTVVERASQPQMGGAWEFFIISQGGSGSIPWVLIDAGGGSGVPTRESSDDSSGGGFYTRRDQVLSHWTDESGTRKYSWDEFGSAPISHLKKRTLTLELRTSIQEVRGYVDGNLEASLKAAEGQYFPMSGRVGVMIKLHDRGDHLERGYVYKARLEAIH